MAEELGEVILRIKAENDQLIQKLNESRAVAQKTAGQIDVALSSASKPVTVISKTSEKATTAVSALGASAAVSGNRMVQVFAQVGTLLVQIKNLFAGVTLAASGIAAVIAGVAAVIGYAVYDTIRWKKAAEEALTVWKEKEKKLADVRKETEKQVTLLRQQIDIEKGIADATDFIGNRAVRLATIELNRVRAAKERKAAVEAESAIVVSRLVALEREISILEGTKTAADFITNAYEKQLTLTRNRLLEEKKVSDELKAQKQAKEDAIKGEGPQSRAEATSTIQQQLDLITARATAVYNLETRINELRKLGHISSFQEEKLRQRLGLGSDLTEEGVASFAGRSNLIDVSQFASGAVSGKVGQDEAKSRDTERNKLLKEAVDEIKKFNDDSGAAQ